MKNKAFQSMEGKVRTELENLIRASKEFINKKVKIVKEIICFPCCNY